MNHLAFDPDDLRLLKHWLWINLKCVVVFTLLLLLFRFNAARMTYSVENRGQGQTIVEQDRGTLSSSEVNASEVIANASMAEGVAQGIGAVAPHGWRRTRDGWQHTSTWTNYSELYGATRSIREIVAIQESREPWWMQVTLEKISRIPPLMIAVMQITAIALICSVSRSRDAA